MIETINKDNSITHLETYLFKFCIRLTADDGDNNYEVKNYDEKRQTLPEIEPRSSLLYWCAITLMLCCDVLDVMQ